jgi:uncharacterized membrane protein (DUF4010 family)
LESFFHFLISGALGALIGLERAIHHRDLPSSYDVGGVRTFTLTSWLGFLSAQLGKEVPGLPLIAFAGFGATILLAYTFHHTERKGITTELAYMGTFGIGFWVGLGEVMLPVTVAVGFVAVLGLKEPISAITQKLTQEEMYATIQFLIVAVVLFPLLSPKPVDPSGILIPRQLGMMLLFASTLSFLGFLIHRFSPSGGRPSLTAIGYGIISSTAYIIELFREERGETKKSGQQWKEAILSSQMMYLKGMILVSWIHPSLARTLVLPALSGFLFGLMPIILARESPPDQRSTPTSSLPNPLHPPELIKLSLLLTALLFLSRILYRSLGEIGLSLGSFLAGLFAMDGITLSLAHSALSEIPLSSAKMGIMLAWAGNNLFKAALLLGLPGAYRKRSAPTILVSTLGFLILSLVNPHAR